MTDGYLPVFDEGDAAMHGWVYGNTDDEAADPALVVDCDCGHLHALQFPPGASITREGDHLVLNSVIFHGPRETGPPEPEPR